MKVPRIVIYLAVLAVVITLLPLAVIAVARTSTTTKAPIHIIQDMDDQEYFKAQQGSTLFEDGRSMRLAPAGTVAWGELREDDHYFRGRSGDEFVADYPQQVTVDEDFIRRGQGRYMIYCAPCHGGSGYGDGMVSRRADALAEGTWTPPSSLHTDTVRERAVGDLYNTVAYGIRNMPGYASQIDVRDRWAIVAYVKALQLSQQADVNELPDEYREGLE